MTNGKPSKLRALQRVWFFLFPQTRWLDSFLAGQGSPTIFGEFRYLADLFSLNLALVQQMLLDLLDLCCVTGRNPAFSCHFLLLFTH